MGFWVVTPTVKTAKTSLIFTNDPSAGNLKFTIQADIANIEKIVGGLTVTPSDLKFSVFIDNYNYKYQNSKLLLVTALFARDSAADSDKTNNAVYLGPSSDGAFFWSPKYTVDGVEKALSTDYTVTDDSFGDSNEIKLPEREGRESSNKLKVIKFSFERGTSIAWDPKVGLGTSDVEGLIQQQNSQQSNSPASTAVSLNQMSNLYLLFLSFVTAILFM